VAALALLAACGGGPPPCAARGGGDGGGRCGPVEHSSLSGEEQGLRTQARRRLCAGKTKFRSKYEAEDAVRRARASWRREMVAYGCVLCGEWHVTVAAAGP
jgi:hypothetical protein